MAVLGGGGLACFWSGLGVMGWCGVIPLNDYKNIVYNYLIHLHLYSKADTYKCHFSDSHK